MCLSSEIFFPLKAKRIGCRSFQGGMHKKHHGRAEKCSQRRLATISRFNLIAAVRPCRLAHDASNPFTLARDISSLFPGILLFTLQPLIVHIRNAHRRRPQRTVSAIHSPSLSRHRCRFRRCCCGIQNHISFFKARIRQR